MQVDNNGYITEVSAETKKILDRHPNRLQFTDSRTEADKANDLFIDMSILEGMPDNRFESTFFRYCKMVEERYAKIIFIPVRVWIEDYGEEAINYHDPKNHHAMANLLRLMSEKPNTMKAKMKDFTIIFYNGGDWFAVVMNEFKKSDMKIIEDNLKLFCSDHSVRGATGKQNKTVKASIPDAEVQKQQKEEVKKNRKDQAVQMIQQAVDATGSEEEAIDYLDKSPDFQELLSQIEDDEYGAPKFSNARTAHMTKSREAFMASTVQGRSVKEMIEEPKQDELPETAIPVHSINDEWQHMQYINFGKEYHIDNDIMRILDSFAKKDYPIVVRDVKVEDTSTSLDYVYTYRVAMEDSNGKRFSLVFDVPKFRNNRFMKLRGNEKVISGQLLNLPCIKTDPDTVQLVSNYNKIFISRYGAAGKTYPVSDRLIRALRKYDGKVLKVTFGDNSRICSKYELPMDYTDIASSITKVEGPFYTFYFNQDEYNKIGNVDRSKVPLAVRKEDKTIVYFEPYAYTSCAEQLVSLMDSEGKGFMEVYNAQKPASKYVYSRASIMASKIPLIVVLGISMRLTDILKHAKIKYSIEDKRTKFDQDHWGQIRFADGYLLYQLSYENSLLMNGLKACNTEAYKVTDLEKKKTWLDFLDDFGGRILADGLENFAQVFVDPITEEICKDIKIPSDYHDMMLYANILLADTKYNNHTDIYGNRFRTSEIIAGHVYKVLARAYGQYRTALRHGKSAVMSIKQSAVIDDILTNNPVTADLSSMSPLIELEASNSATFKGLSGLNTDRAYGLDKRTYDPTMINKLALSTGFSTNIGVTRQTTMDMDIKGTRGYIKQTDPKDISVTKRLSATEAVTPFGSTRDDPFRTAMTHIQTSKHAMPTNKAAPLLVTNGADEAMAYMVSDTYVYRAKMDGQVTEIVPDEYMIVTYKDKSSDYISLKEESKKNSDGGFYITIKLGTDMKVKQKFLENEILAYDHATFSNRVGEADGIAYNVGTLTRVAILTTDEGFEDSCSISTWLSEAMGSSVDTEIPIDLNKSANVYEMVKAGQPIQEGDPLIIFQNAFDDADANMLLKNITDTDFVSDLGRIRIKAKYTGLVQQIKMYRTCEIEEMSESLQKIFRAYEAGIKRTKGVYKKYGITGANTLDPDYKMAQTGTLKNTVDGVRICFYVKYVDKMGVGDKLVWQSANKGVAKYVIPEGLEPYTKSAPDKPIHALGSSRSFNARMVTSPIISGAINKALIGLDEQVKTIMGIKVPRIEDLQ